MSRELKDVYGFIYITTNMVNGKRYIGQKKFEEGTNLYRWKSYLGSGTTLKRAIKKYGKDNFHRDIIDVAYSEKELNNKEKHYINIYDAINSDDYYNIAEGGRKDPFAGKTDEEILEIRRKASESLSKVNKGENHPNFGKKTKEETKIKISKSLKGRPLSEERKKNISLGLKRRNNKNKFNLNVRNFSTSKAENSSRSKKKHINSRCSKNKILCITTGIIYNNLKDASSDTGANPTSISKCCNGKRKTAGKLSDGTKLTWKVIEG